MKRYWLFAYMEYEEDGGFRDWKAEFDTVAEALPYLRAGKANPVYGYKPNAAHLVDIESKGVIAVYHMRDDAWEEVERWWS